MRASPQERGKGGPRMIVHRSQPQRRPREKPRHMGTVWSMGALR